MNVNYGSAFARSGALFLSMFGTCILVSGNASATLITDAGPLGFPTVIDFSQFTGPYTFTTGPVPIGALVGDNVTWESTSPLSVIGDGSIYGLGGNGSWDNGRVGFTGANSDTAQMTYRFLDGPVQGVGGFVNYTIASDGPSDAFISVLDINGAVLESFNVVTLAPISTPSTLNDGAFRGILRSSADIYALRLTGRFSVLDNLTYSNEVPEPTSVLLVGMCLIGTGLLTLRSGSGRL